MSVTARTRRLPPGRDILLRLAPAWRLSGRRYRFHPTLYGLLYAGMIAALLVGYVQDLLEVSRLSGRFAFGLSPRAGLALLRAARAWALLAGRDWALPEDVQQVLPHVAGHRLRHADTLAEVDPAELATVFQGVPVPA